MAIENSKQLRESMMSDYQRATDGLVNPAATNACANIAGKVMQSVRLELEYALARGESPDIDYFNKK